MTKSQQQLEHVVVTFFEAGVAYISINQTNLHGDWKPVAIGALGAALSAVYNLLRQSNPTIADDNQIGAQTGTYNLGTGLDVTGQAVGSILDVQTQLNPAEVPLNGVNQLTQPGTTVSPDPTGEPTTTPPVPPAATV